MKVQDNHGFIVGVPISFFFFFEDLLISIQQFVRISSLHKQVTVEKGGADLFGCEGEIKVTIFLLEIHKTFQKGSNEARPTQKL